MTRSVPRLAIAALLLLLAAWLATRQPVPGPWPLLPGALVLWGVACARWPHLWLFLLPTLLAVVNLAPWTGRYFLDVPDLALLVAVAVELARRGALLPLPLGRLARLAILAVALSLAASLLFGAAAESGVLLRRPGPNDLFDYLSPWNAVRVAKGTAWALVLLPLLGRLTRERPQGAAWLARGLALALALVAIAALRERWLYTDFLDFSRDYRVVATFASMRVGGSHIGALLVLALPAGLALLVAERSGVIRLLATAALLLGLAALFLTYTRAAWLGAAAGLGICVLGLAISRRPGIGSRAWRGALAAVAALVAVAVFAGAVSLSGYARQRLAAAPEDLRGRLEIFAHALAMMDATAQAQLLGMGVGSFPRLYYARNQDGTAPSRREIVDDIDGNRFMRMAAGRPGRYPEELLFTVNQRIEIRPHERWTMGLRVRSPNGGGLTIEIKEKPTLQGGRGIEVVQLADLAPDWRDWQGAFDTGTLGVGPLELRRAATLVLRASPAGAVVDLDDFWLVDGLGNDVLRNGGFARGHEGWTFEAAHHVAYQVKNLFVGTYFDQGAFGLAALLLLLVAVAVELPDARRRQPVVAAGLAGGIAGFLVFGLFDNSLTEPRIALLFLVVAFQIVVLAGTARIPAAGPGLR